MILSIHGHRSHSQFNFKEYDICVCAVSYNKVISNTDIMTKNANVFSSTLLNTRGGTVLLLELEGIRS